MTLWRRDFERSGERVSVLVQADGAGAFQIQVGERAYRVTARALPGGRVRFENEGRVHLASGVVDRRGAYVRVDGRTWDLPFHTGRRGSGTGVGDGRVMAPMTGTVLQVLVEEGDRVAPDQAVAVLTAMKMEHRLVAGVAGTVVGIETAEGRIAAQGDLLVQIEPIVK